MTVRLVVYGLLRRGASMSGLLSGAEFLGEVTVPGFGLYDLGDFPGAVALGDVVAGEEEGGVVGELYELPSPAVLDLLDEAEHVHADPPLYTRALIEAQGAPAWFYVYARPVDAAARIPSGDWFSRRSPREGRSPG
jgi:gamma-glutamylcyclotransferase (GGCT)/AIG2-like uncharacterized protein YtfP